MDVKIAGSGNKEFGKHLQNIIIAVHSCKIFIYKYRILISVFMIIILHGINQ